MLRSFEQSSFGQLSFSPSFFTRNRSQGWAAKMRAGFPLVVVS
jgi:hypothetical protein